MKLYHWIILAWISLNVLTLVLLGRTERELNALEAFHNGFVAGRGCDPYSLPVKDKP